MIHAGLMLLNWTFHAVHMGIILLNMFGWLFPSTQKATLTFQVLTLMSWVGLGSIYGF